jgi:hypothetical protein
MAASLEVAGDVAAAGGALAGLVLVFLGAVSTDFSSIPAENRHFVVASYRRRAWFAFVGLSLCLAAVSVALIAKRFALPWAGDVALALLAIALIWILIAGAMTAREIN